MLSFIGGFIFAEHPALLAPDARIIWSAALDPGAIRVEAVCAAPGDPEAIDPAALAPWLTVVVDCAGREHALLSDGRHNIRLDLDRGSLRDQGAVVLHYRIHGRHAAESRILPLRRLLHLCRYRRFAVSLFPPDPRIARGVLLLRVHDALVEGASQRDIGRELVGAEHLAREWAHPSDALRSRVRRLIADARRLARGGYPDNSKIAYAMSLRGVNVAPLPNTLTNQQIGATRRFHDHRRRKTGLPLERWPSSA